MNAVHCTILAYVLAAALLWGYALLLALTPRPPKTTIPESPPPEALPRL